MRRFPEGSFTNFQVLSTVVVLPSLFKKETLPIDVALSAVIKIAEFFTVHFFQPIKAKPLSFGKAGLPPTK